MQNYSFVWTYSAAYHSLFSAATQKALILQTSAFGKPAGKPHNVLCLYQHISVVCVYNCCSKVILD